MLHALKRSQQLYSSVYNGCGMTERYAWGVLEGKEKGLLWKMGKMLLEGGIGEDMVRANAQAANPKKVFTGFVLLFMVEKVSSLTQLRSNADTLMWYFLVQWKHHQSLTPASLKQL